MKKIVLITGATSGMGKATAELLAQKDYIVYGTGRNPQSSPKEYSLLKMDIRNEQEVQQAVEEIIKKEGKIDVLINNAGVGISGAMEEIPMQELHNIFQTNYFGALTVMRAVLPYMRKAKNGLIINITSIAGYMGLPFRGAYSASKAALSITTEAMRMELKPFGVELCTIAPGDFATDIASRRYHTPVMENSPYRDIYKMSLNMINEGVDKGLHPSIMAQKILHIMQTQAPAVHYKQGSFLQKFSIVLKRILPSKVYEKMLMNHYKL